MCGFVIAATMKKPGHYSSYLLPVGRISEREARTVTQRLRGVRGVVDAVVVADEGVAYLKVDRGDLDEPGLQAAAGSAPA